MSRFINGNPSLPSKEAQKLVDFIERDPVIANALRHTVILALPAPPDRRFRGVAWLDPRNHPPTDLPPSLRFLLRWAMESKPRFLITIEMSTNPLDFPCDNLSHMPVWKPVEAGENVFSVFLSNGGRVKIEEDGTLMTYTETELVPYGGKSSPIITHHNWRELFIAILAHESWHIIQELSNHDPEETPCEIYGLKRLLEWRESTDRLYLQYN